MRPLSDTAGQLGARRSARPPLSAAQRTVRLIAVLVVLAVVVGAAAYLFATRTAPGRRLIANRLEDAVSGAIPGSMRVGELERVGARELVVRDLRFLQANGEPVLTVERAEIDADVQAMLTGTIAFENARVRGGHLIIGVEPSGTTGLEAAFAEQSESQAGGGEAAELQMQSVHVQDLTLTIRPSKDDLFRLQEVKGFVAIAQHGPPGVRVRLERISGKLQKPQFLGAGVTITRADGLIRGGAERVIDLELRAELEGDRFDAHLQYYNRDHPPKVELELEPKEGIATHLAAFAADVRTLFTDQIDVRIE